jgi:transposase
VRVNAAFCRLLRLEGVWVRGVAFDPDRVVVRVALRRRRLVCPSCSYSTRWIENTQAHESVWRHLDLGVWRLEVRATLRRLRCPTHGVRVEGVPFAREGSRFTADLEDLVTWLVTKCDRTAVCRLVRVDWQTIGRISERVGQEKLDPGRLDGLYEIGIDEVSWRKQHRYLTLVVDHRRGQVVWGTDGAGAVAADRFFAELDPPKSAPPRDPGAPPQLVIAGVDNEAGAAPQVGERAAKIAAISMDMGPGYALSAREHAPHAVICIDPFHVVALTTRALDEVRRGYWNELRSLDDKQAAKRFKDARWVLLKNPENLTEKQAATHRKLRDTGGDVWHAYTLKEALRSIFNSELEIEDVTVLLDEFITSAAQSALAPFVRLAQTIRKHREGILAAVRLGVNNARVEALNNKVRLITRRAYGFHTARAALALVYLTCGPIDLTLPHEHD